jgi:hypothetical protein
MLTVVLVAKAVEDSFAAGVERISAAAESRINAHFDKQAERSFPKRDKPPSISTAIKLV